MIIGIGIDIVDNRRIASTLERFGEKFQNRCFSKNEIKVSESVFNKINSYSKRYAAKEACAKALGIGISKGVFWKDIEVENNKYGQPFIKLHNEAYEIIKKISKNKYRIKLSLSDEKNYSIANVIIYEDEKYK